MPFYKEIVSKLPGDQGDTVIEKKFFSGAQFEKCKKNMLIVK